MPPKSWRPSSGKRSQSSAVCTTSGQYIETLGQKGRGGGLASAFGGAGGNTAFGSKTGDVLTWISIVTDPAYLTEPYIKSRNFVLDPGYQVTLYPCSTDVEVPREVAVRVPARLHQLFDGVLEADGCLRRAHAMLDARRLPRRDHLRREVFREEARQHTGMDQRGDVLAYHRVHRAARRIDEDLYGDCQVSP